MDASKDIKNGGLRKRKGVRAASSRKERKAIFLDGGLAEAIFILI
jgi:hypothetical protein